MDAIELLAREDEFKRLNKQLEKKTESLMKEIEHVMQKQDFFSEFSPSLAVSTRQNFKKHCCTPPSQPETPNKRYFKKKTLKSTNIQSPKSLTDDSEIESKTSDTRNPDFESQNRGNSECESHTLKNETRNINFESNELSKRRDSEFESKPKGKRKNETDRHTKVICDCCPHNGNSISSEMEFLYAFVNINVKDKVLPPSFAKEDRVSVESVCKFLSSKIKLMQEQIDKLQATIEKKASQCESHLTQLAELESERMSLLNKTNNMKTSTADMRAKYLAVQKRLEEKDRLYKELRSETDKQTSELKRLRSRNASVEAKCASQELVVDSLRQQLDMCKRNEKEVRESSRQLSATCSGAISRCEAETRRLRARTGRQAALLRNLREQNALLAAAGALTALDDEYAALLKRDL